jgi:ribosomal protein S30
LKACKALTKAGNLCQATPQVSSDYCVAHDPARKAQQQAQRSLGGKIKAKKGQKPAETLPRPKTRAEILAMVEKAASQVAHSQISAQQASALSSLARILLREGPEDDGPGKDDAAAAKGLSDVEIKEEALLALTTDELRAELKRREG